MPAAPKLPTIGQLQYAALNYEDGLFDTAEHARLMGCVNPFDVTNYYEYSVFTPIIKDMNLNRGKVAQSLRTWFSTVTLSVGNRYSRTLVMILADNDNIKYEIRYDLLNSEVEQWTVNADVPEKGRAIKSADSNGKPITKWEQHVETQKTLFKTTDYDSLIDWLNTPYQAKRMTVIK